MTERLDLAVACGQAVLRPTSQSASQTAPLVGEPLAKRLTFPICQSLPSIGEVASRSDDGEVFYTKRGPDSCPALFLCRKPLRHRCAMPPPLSRGGFGISEKSASSPEAPLLGELSAKQTERLDEGQPARRPPPDPTSPSSLTRCHLPYRGEALAFRKVLSSY